MQRSLAIAIVLGALIIAAALLYHGGQLSELSVRLAAMEQRTNGLDQQLEQFSGDLPHIVEKAGNKAGRQAVQGMVDEVAQLPSMLMARARNNATGSNGAQSASSGQPGNLDEGQGAPWLQLDIRDPVINIRILPNLKEIPAIPWSELIDKKMPLPPESGDDGTSEIDAETSTESE